MKRFWKDADAIERAGGWGIFLDARPLKTPARAELILPNATLGRAVREEWAAAGETVDPRTMPLTGLANAAVDHVARDTRAFAASLARYGEADLFCYRAVFPAKLVERQAAAWDPLLAWARRRFDVDFVITDGVIHQVQPPATVARLGHELSLLDPFRLAGLAPLVTIGGSLIAGLAVLEGVLAVELAWDAVSLDERWQIDQWGADVEAVTSLASRRAGFEAGARFLTLV